MNITTIIEPHWESDCVPYLFTTLRCSIDLTPIEQLLAYYDFYTVIDLYVENTETYHYQYTKVFKHNTSNIVAFECNVLGKVTSVEQITGTAQAYFLCKQGGTNEN